MPDDIKIEKIILYLIQGTKNFLREISTLLDVRDCPKLQCCAISRRTNDTTLG